ncbi:glycosyltransferase involved in cell wall biosynthesis [Luteimicrobium subarcticum]|uniref:Glycosyltransferase involved in cell wall biosynthesis n=1 Tax=Luteimicrobium subarcticum TaxID=620910 RepID=A0A2M8WTI9_9MICO|nr:glycosyltransferase involved in cell wall biosynthesis [Luteimicrobium subarcticum]
MRVLVVTVVHDPADARIRHRQIAAMVEAGWDVTYAAPFTAYGREPVAGVTAVDLPRAAGRRRLGAVRAARRLLAARTADVDVVLLHDPDLLLAVPRRARRRGTAVVWDVHEDTAAAVTMRGWIPGPLRSLAAWGVRRAERWAERHVDLVLAEPGYVARFARPHPVVPNSVRVPAAFPDAPVQDRVVYLGKLTAARGARELVALGAALASEVTVELVGPATGEVADELAAAAGRGDVDWAGFVPNDAALARLDGALAGLSLLHDEPNYAHSQPTKVFEYMAHGLPVVTTPNPASVQVVESAGAGLVVPFGDVAAAAAAVRRLRDDRPERDAMARRGYDDVRQHHDWGADRVAFLGILDQFAHRAGSPSRDVPGTTPGNPA